MARRVPPAGAAEWNECRETDGHKFNALHASHPQARAAPHQATAACAGSVPIASRSTNMSLQSQSFLVGEPASEGSEIASESASDSESLSRFRFGLTAATAAASGDLARRQVHVHKEPREPRPSTAITTQARSLFTPPTTHHIGPRASPNLQAHRCIFFSRGALPSFRAL